MTEAKQVYLCQVCGIVVETLEGGAGEPVCCGRTMTLQREKTAGRGAEKHLPVIESGGGAVTVRVGSEPHPMAHEHLIQWIDVASDGRTCRQFLRPGQAPQATFPAAGGDLTIRAYCSIHGLWRAP